MTRLGTICTTYIVVVLATLDIILSRFYGTHLYAYAWIVSSSFISGYVAFSLQLVVFLLLIVFLFYRLSIVVDRNKTMIREQVDGAGDDDEEDEIIQRRKNKKPSGGHRIRKMGDGANTTSINTYNNGDDEKEEEEEEEEEQSARGGNGECFATAHDGGEGVDASWLRMIYQEECDYEEATSRSVSKDRLHSSTDGVMNHRHHHHHHSSGGAGGSRRWGVLKRVVFEPPATKSPPGSRPLPSAAADSSVIGELLCYRVNLWAAPLQSTATHPSSSSSSSLR